MLTIDQKINIKSYFEGCNLTRIMFNYYAFDFTHEYGTLHTIPFNHFFKQRHEQYKKNHTWYMNQTINLKKI